MKASRKVSKTLNNEQLQSKLRAFHQNHKSSNFGTQRDYNNNIAQMATSKGTRPIDQNKCSE